MKKILLAGDSWGWVWFPFGNEQDIFTSKTHTEKLEASSHKHLFDTGDHKHSYPLLCILLEHYGFDITYVACPGSSNFHQLDMIDHRLRNNSYDMIIFLHTDPLRDLTHGYHHEEFIEKTGLNTWSLSKLLYELDEVYKKLYQKLDDYCNHYDLPVLLLGGHSCVSSKHLEKYRTSPLLHCVSEHILTDIVAKYRDQQVDFHPLGFNSLTKYVDDSWNPALINYFYENFYNGELLGDFMMPDNRHMNAGSAILAVEMLLQYMEEHKLI